MDKYYYVKPTIGLKNQAKEFIEEYFEYSSDISGDGSLHKYINDYENWLIHLEEERTRIPGDKLVPGETFFLLRERDDRILGTINIRLVLNDNLRRFGGNIGYSIRPLERRKGINKINLYLGLLYCYHNHLQEVMIDCAKSNLGSALTVKALGGQLKREYFDFDHANCMVQDYTIDVRKSLIEYNDIYSKLISSKHKL